MTGQCPDRCTDDDLHDYAAHHPDPELPRRTQPDMTRTYTVTVPLGNGAELTHTIATPADAAPVLRHMARAVEHWHGGTTNTEQWPVRPPAPTPPRAALDRTETQRIRRQLLDSIAADWLRLPERGTDLDLQIERTTDADGDTITRRYVTYWQPTPDGDATELVRREIKIEIGEVEQ